jgi:hypothetical protein
MPGVFRIRARDETADIEAQDSQDRAKQALPVREWEEI